MESDDISIHGQELGVKVFGGQVNVGPKIVVEGDIDTIHEKRKLICCHCTKSVGVLTMPFEYSAHKLWTSYSK